MAAKTKQPPRDLEAEITARVIASMEAGTVPWRKPWTTMGALRNAVSKKPYRGINPFLLDMAAGDGGWHDPRWLTFKQCAEKGGSLKGEKGTTIIFWKVVTEDRFKVKLDRPFRVLRHYTVFNAEQTTGIEWEPLVEKDPSCFEINEAAQAVIDGYPNRPKMGWGGDVAYYRPSTDHVQLPDKVSFDTAAAYYSVAFHELGHSTGHETRLNRPELAPHAMVGESYSREELVAEMTAAMLLSSVGMENQYPFEQHASYIETWLGRLADGDNKGLLIQAAAKAQRAVDHILDTKWES